LSAYELTNEIEAAGATILFSGTKSVNFRYINGSVYKNTPDGEH